MSHGPSELCENQTVGTPPHQAPDTLDTSPLPADTGVSVRPPLPHIQTAMRKDLAEEDMLDVEPLTLPSVLSPIQRKFPDDAAPPVSTNNPPEKIPRGHDDKQQSKPRSTRASRPPYLKLPPEWKQRHPALTVSAVLSRSGQLHPLPSRHGSTGEAPAPWNDYFQTWEPEKPPPEQVTNEDTLLSTLPATVRELVRTIMSGSGQGTSTQRAGRHHTGSALEAIELGPWIPSLHQWRGRCVSWVRRQWEGNQRRPLTPAVPESEHDLPGTPLMMPGGFSLDSDELQMLPPPLLDDNSDAHSFEGLLGVRRLREQQARSQYLDQLRLANRPAHRVDTFTAFFNFVRSAQASESRRSKTRGRDAQVHGPKLPELSLAQRRHSASSTKEEAVTTALPDRGVATRRSAPTLAGESLAEDAAALDLSEDASPSPRAKERLTPFSLLESSTPLRGSPASHTPSQKSEDTTPSWTNEARLSDVWVAVSFILVCVTFVPDFVVFVLAHIVDVLIEAYECASYLVWFVGWVWKNVTGQTILGRIVIDSYFMFQSEWEHVVREDHEGTGDPMRRLLGIPLFPRPRGLSTVQVLRGLLELACIQTVTRMQYEREGAGLARLSWQRPVSPGPSPDAKPRDDASNDDDDDDDEDLLVTSQSMDILELSRIHPDEREHVSSLDAAAILWDEDEAALVRNIKWASQLAMSAYGLRVLIVDLPPVFTPSGRQLPRQTFAHLTRLDADDVLHADIQTLDMEATYLPTFYVVRDLKRKVVCVAVRGTQSFADIVVDLDMKTEDITATLAEWRGMEVDASAERYAYHAGIWRAAKTLVSPQSTLFRKLCETLNEHKDFGLVFVGHSLGGAIASAAAILLSEYHLESPEDDPRRGFWRTTAQDGFPAGRPIRAMTFGHPSTLSHTLQRRTSYGRVPLVTTMILGSDIIPRFGHGQVRELRRVLGALTRVRRRRGRVSAPAPTDDDDDLTVHILRRFWDWTSICRTKNPDAVMLNRKARLEALFWRLRCAVENDLFSQAKQRFDQAVAQQALATHAPLSPWIPASSQADVPLHTLSSRRQRLDYATLRSETAQGGVLVPAGRVVWLSKGELYDITNPMAFFSLPDLHVSMFADHFPAAYEEAILALGRGGA
ncbi:hypothetical protein MCAP1_001596 [Malassezia caprae]|uniref:sn-1-specific diacylglycerol lipase n=1 Tax=Malassezia caprae TaxID=1381934 RepID=A0AAF0E9U9_9BASI|nr:hypothetical protein MCAP1_001596 [Malassezia caprae]